MEIARLKNLEEDARKKEFENQELEKVLVRKEEAIELTTKPWKSVARVIKDLPARLAVQCNPSDPELAREVITEAVREILEALSEAFEKLKPKDTK